jgi:uncharacterized protein (TIGR02265 family)
MVRRIQVRPDVPLIGELDPEARMATWPTNLRIKGMFFTHLIEILGADAAKLLAKLDDPPRNDRYLPFVDYPQLDHARLFIAAARKKFPGVGLHEAMRQLGRANYDAFLTSTVGQVMASMTKDAQQALARLPDALKLVHPVGTITTARLGDRSTKIVYRGYVGWLDCTMIGTVESIVTRFASPPTIDIEWINDMDADYVVKW